jgi:hypothetical protein
VGTRTASGASGCCFWRFWRFWLVLHSLAQWYHGYCAASIGRRVRHIKESVYPLVRSRSTMGDSISEDHVLEESPPEPIHLRHGWESKRRMHETVSSHLSQTAATTIGDAPGDLRTVSSESNRVSRWLNSGSAHHQTVGAARIGKYCSQRTCTVGRPSLVRLVNTPQLTHACVHVRKTLAADAVKNLRASKARSRVRPPRRDSPRDAAHVCHMNFGSRYGDSAIRDPL